MPRKSHRQHRTYRCQGGKVIINKKDYTRHDYMSPGKLVAWAEWIPAAKESGVNA